MLPEDPDAATFRRLILRDDRQVFERPCKEAFYTHFLSVVRDVPKEILLLCAPGPGGHAVALVAITGTGPSEAMVGGARYVTGLRAARANLRSPSPMRDAVSVWPNS